MPQPVIDMPIESTSSIEIVDEQQDKQQTLVQNTALSADPELE